MVGSHPSTLEEQRRALLQVRLRRKQEEILTQQRGAPVQREGPSRHSQATVSPLVPLRPEGTRPPLFLVHAVGGSVAPYVGLATLLGDDQPVYALEHPGLHGGEIEARALPDIAAAYLAVVREVQPDGPLRLGGWSAGGAVALEMTRQDGDVALVLVLDTRIPDAPSEPDDDQLRVWFAADIAGMGAELDETERSSDSRCSPQTCVPSWRTVRRAWTRRWYCFAQRTQNTATLTEDGLFPMRSMWCLATTTPCSDPHISRHWRKRCATG